MTKPEAKKRVEKLREEINRHRYFYHVLDRLDISDAAFDSLKNELEELELQFPDLVTPDSPTQRVGGEPLKEFKKKPHETPMLSLFDAFGEEELRAWEKRIMKILNPPNSLAKASAGELPPFKRGAGGLDYFCELKMDGLAVSLEYEDGIFKIGSTRGNGLVGEDVTQNLRTVSAIPLRLREPETEELEKAGFSAAEIKKIQNAARAGRLEVRGEAVMTTKVFEELNEKLGKEGKPLLANPRNGAAGSIRQLDPKITASRKLDYYVYQLVTDLGQKRHGQEHEIAKFFGFKTAPQNQYRRDLEAVIEFHKYWSRKRDQLPFECDGVVVVVNDLNLHKKLGVVGKAPRYMIAFKFEGKEATTVVQDIVLNVGRTGILTPVAVLKPVAVGGVTISHATLHNEDEIKRLDLKIGDTVIVRRAGDVIPEVTQVLPKMRTGKEKEFRMPQKCPMCGGLVLRRPGEAAHRCLAKDCFAVSQRRIRHFVSKAGLDIEGLGQKIVEQLMREGLVRDPADFYELEEGDLTPLERFAEKSAKNLIESIDKSRRAALNRFLAALGILHVGEETAIALANRFGDIKKIAAASLGELSAIPDIGPVVAKSIREWFNEKKNQKLLERLLKEIKIENPQTKKQKQSLEGMTIVLTGELKSLTRAQAKEAIRERGGDISSSVSAKTDLLVAGEEPGSKFDRAKSLGVKIIEEEEFLKLIE